MGNQKLEIVRFKPVQYSVAVFAKKAGYPADIRKIICNESHIVQTWLREHHGLLVEVFFSSGYNWSVQEVGDNQAIAQSKKEYVDYNDALELGLQYAIDYLLTKEEG